MYGGAAYKRDAGTGLWVPQWRGSVNFNSNNDRIRRTTQLFTPSSYTVVGKVRFASVTAFKILWASDDGSSTSLEQIGIITGDVFGAETATDVVDFLSGASPVTTSWYSFAVAFNGTVVTWHVLKCSDWTVYSGTDSSWTAQGAVTQQIWGSNFASEFLSGNLSNCYVVPRVMNADELQRATYQLAPLEIEPGMSWLPFGSEAEVHQLIDLADARRLWAKGATSGSWTMGEPPPLPWFAQRMRLVVPVRNSSGSGAQSIDGASALTGATAGAAAVTTQTDAVGTSVPASPTGGAATVLATTPVVGDSNQLPPTGGEAAVTPGAVDIAGAANQVPPTGGAATVTPGAVDVAGTSVQDAPAGGAATITTATAVEGASVQVPPTGGAGALTSTADVAGGSVPASPTGGAADLVVAGGDQAIVGTSVAASPTVGLATAAGSSPYTEGQLEQMRVVRSGRNGRRLSRVNHKLPVRFARRPRRR